MMKMSEWVVQKVPLGYEWLQAGQWLILLARLYSMDISNLAFQDISARWILVLLLYFLAASGCLFLQFIRKPL